MDPRSREGVWRVADSASLSLSLIKPRRRLTLWSSPFSMVVENEWDDRDSHLKANQVNSDIVSLSLLSPPWNHAVENECGE